jgi:hypothetical protein
MNKIPDEISSAYRAFRDDFENYCGVLYTAMSFDPEEPVDMLRFIGTFAGFCDRVDEAKHILFEEFEKFAREYYRHFKNAPKEVQEAQRTENAAMMADDDLIKYVIESDTEDEFWTYLCTESSNVMYLLLRSSYCGESPVAHEMRCVYELMRRWQEMLERQKQDPEG